MRKQFLLQYLHNQQKCLSFTCELKAGNVRKYLQIKVLSCNNKKNVHCL